MLRFERNFFDQPIKNDKNIYNSIDGTSQGDNQTSGQLVDYIYLKKIAIDLSKQQKKDADPKAIQQINFTRNLE